MEISFYCKNTNKYYYTTKNEENSYICRFCKERLHKYGNDRHTKIE